MKGIWQTWAMLSEEMAHFFHKAAFVPSMPIGRVQKSLPIAEVLRQEELPVKTFLYGWVTFPQQYKFAM